MPARAALCGTAVFLVVTSSLIGCGESADNTLSRENVIGTWLEDPSLIKARGGSVVVTGLEASRRQLLFSSDRTFTMAVCDPDGQPLEPPQFVTGTWRIRGNGVVFRIKDATLDSRRARWVPDRFIKLRLKAHGAPCDYLDIRGRDGIRVRYRRIAPEPVRE